MKKLILSLILSSFLFSTELFIFNEPFHAAKENVYYVFIPDVQSPTPVFFSIENKPYWAKFDSKTGKLSGVPGVGDIGIYKNILISVKNDNNSTSYPVFDIEVYTLVKEETYTGYKVIGMLLAIMFAISVMY